MRKRLLLFPTFITLSWSTAHIAQATLKPWQTISAAWSNATHVDLFATNASGEVVSTWWDGGCRWQPWFLIHPEVKMQPGATVTAIWRSNHTHLDLFVTGTDGAVESTWWEGQPGWQKWFVIHPEVRSCAYGVGK